MPTQQEADEPRVAHERGESQRLAGARARALRGCACRSRSTTPRARRRGAARADDCRPAVGDRVMDRAPTTYPAPASSIAHGTATRSADNARGEGSVPAAPACRRHATNVTAGERVGAHARRACEARPPVIRRARSRAWRRNALTSSSAACSGRPSRHSATATPARCRRCRSASRRRIQMSYASASSPAADAS